MLFLFSFLLHKFRIVIPIFRYLFIPLACGSEPFSFFKLDFFFSFFFHQVELEKDDGRWASPIKISYTLEREKFSPPFRVFIDRRETINTARLFFSPLYPSPKFLAAHTRGRGHKI